MPIAIFRAWSLLAELSNVPILTTARLVYCARAVPIAGLAVCAYLVTTPSPHIVFKAHTLIINALTMYALGPAVPLGAPFPGKSEVAFTSTVNADAVTAAVIGALTRAAVSRAVSVMALAGSRRLTVAVPRAVVRTDLGRAVHADVAKRTLAVQLRLGHTGSVSRAVVGTMAL